ncbi:MAG: lytic transglycosylase [Halobacteriovorax sp.]|nr:lytic transglycosylase [Halobacteriovorax sp.]
MFMNNFKNLSILLASSLVLLGGCASHQEVSQTPEEYEKNISKNMQKALEAQRQAVVHRNDSQIIGSSKIKEPNKHKTKTYFLYGAEHLKLENYYFDIPVVYNAKVKRWIDYFLTRGRGFFQRYSGRAGRYAPLMGKILEDNGLPRDLIFLAMAESGFQNKAKSWARAVGPWQFMPFTGKRFGLKIDWYIDERRDPIKATIASSKYLRKLFEDFGSWELAAAGYNAGEGKIGRAIRRYRTENFWKISKGRYLKPETKNYVPKIMALAIIGKNLKSFGFEDIDFSEPLDFEEIELPANTDLMKVAKAIEVDFEEIQRLNPELLRWHTPPNVEKYRLRIPVGFQVAWSRCCESEVGTFAATEYMKYKVRGKNARLSHVAKKYKIKKSYVLEKLNPGLTAKSKLKRGTLITLPFREGQNIKANMYADLYERPRKRVRRYRAYRKRINIANRRGKKISNPKVYYTVKKGDSLWTVARKNGLQLNDLIASNMKLLKRRMIRPGDRLAVR